MRFETIDGKVVVHVESAFSVEVKQYYYQYESLIEAIFERLDELDTTRFDVLIMDNVKFVFLGYGREVKKFALLGELRSSPPGMMFHDALPNHKENIVLPILSVREYEHIEDDEDESDEDNRGVDIRFFNHSEYKEITKIMVSRMKEIISEAGEEG